MMRLSFLLLLMAAVACCKTNSPTGHEECAKLGNITQFDLPVSFDVHSLPNVIKNSAECNKDTPILWYRQENRSIVTAGEIVCINGMWLVENMHNGHRNWFKNPEVWCMGLTRTDGRPQTDEPQKCAAFDEITQGVVDADLPDYVNERSSVTFRDGRLFCSNATDKMYYMVLHISEASQIVCTGGSWFVDAIHSYEFLENIHVSCIHSVKKKPKKQNECEPIDHITQSQFNEHLPGFEVTNATVKKNNVTCSDPTKSLYFLANDGARYLPADSVTCNTHNGHWFWVIESLLGTQYYGIPTVACTRRTTW